MRSQNDSPKNSKMIFPRALAALADAFDEHLGLVRVADEEAFDIVTLNKSMAKFLGGYDRKEFK